jgi:hypothetical protein
MLHRIEGGIVFTPPPGFVTDETMLALRAEGRAAPPAASKPAPGGSRRPSGATARPSLIVHSRPARPGAAVERIAGEFAAELAQSIPGMRSLTTVPFRFEDGAEGVLIAYDFPAIPGTDAVRQYHALRLDGGRVTELTLTVPSAGLTDELGETYLKSLASARLEKAKK